MIQVLKLDDIVTRRLWADTSMRPGRSMMLPSETALSFFLWKYSSLQLAVFEVPVFCEAGTALFLWRESSLLLAVYRFCPDFSLIPAVFQVPDTSV